MQDRNLLLQPRRFALAQLQLLLQVGDLRLQGVLLLPRVVQQLVQLGLVAVLAVLLEFVYLRAGVVEERRQRADLDLPARALLLRQRELLVELFSLRVGRVEGAFEQFHSLGQAVDVDALVQGGLSGFLDFDVELFLFEQQGFAFVLGILESGGGC